ncbi:uncharacterized protein EI97DRAFT_433805 [Westerdykella ornata]|uniref:Cation efflux protein transmembrane domain-containing protein n=1 Tax=Westerdykella ornata TaxID=318751 RepID=A0A6A6JJI8_WESOR|nr:uncharacterized protein EI97DRAFT_433805 [Westerdykella ornata]KAF2275856.1 hypothetical protein EI97DRAFT_433805 [Westerdykella ornata]
MLLRNTNGLLFSQCRGRVRCCDGPRSPLYIQIAATAATNGGAGTGPGTGTGSPAAVTSLQRRVLRTSSTASAASSTRRRPTTVNWSFSTAVLHRGRHLPPPPSPLPPPIMTSTQQQQQQRRGHAGHGHHHHAHDNTYLISSNKKDAGVRITRIGLYVNLGMALSKGLGGYVFNSQALVADAIHALTDLVSDVMTLATVSWSLKPPSARFPSGYGKVESLGSLGVSGILLGGGLMMGWAAIIALCQQFLPEFAEWAAHWGLLPHSHGHHHGVGELGPSIHAAWLAAGSILIKEWLYRATLKVAKDRKSSVLASNAYHHRVDSLTAFVALVMIAGSNLLRNAQWLDPVGGLIISMMVVQAGWANTKMALFELADVGIDKEMRDNVRRATLRALADVNINSGSEAQHVEIRAVQGIKSGQNYLIDLELAAPGQWSIEQTRGVEELVRERLGAKVRGVKRVRVRFVSKDSAEHDYLDEFIAGDDSARSTPEVEREREHEHEHEHEHSHAHEEETKESVRKRR